jgi:hypothetical protein
MRLKINDTYDITIEGNVINAKTGRTLKTFLAGKGYKYLRLGAGKKYIIHRLVANAFLPSPTSDNCEVDHIDRNKLNNHASNLRWVSHSENMQNLNTELKPRASNKLGHHHIKRIMLKTEETQLYTVIFHTKTFKHYSSYKTIEDAIKNRDLIIEQNAISA